ncbi:MAG: DUF4160 domain-containing protein [Dorea sp.]|nr:DUF4160 domain-containing protein [Dorea sp.]
MPEISNFYGINVKMFYKPKEHEPAHIHVFNGSYVAIYDIRTSELLGGSLPTRAQELTREWLKIHQDTLEGMWDMQVYRQLPPLKLNKMIMKIPRIKKAVAGPNFVLQVAFDDGKRVAYDLKPDIKTLPKYDILRESLFKEFVLDESRTCIIWTDEVDLPSDIIYEYGTVI